MSEDAYVLKKEVSDDVLTELNSSLIPENRLFKAQYVDQFYPPFDVISDWMSAIKSGKKIVNPMPPKEELIKYREDILNGKKAAMTRISMLYEMVDIIAKKHPDVATWLDGDA